MCPLEYGKCGNEGGKITKIWKSKEWKKLFRLNKRKFDSFWKAITW